MRKVSVIIPTHNRKASLERLLASLALQTYAMEQVEVIVVANGCEDGTNEMLGIKKYPFQMVPVVMGMANAAQARNKGAGIAQGEQFIFLDDDIEASPGMLEAFVRAMDHQQKVVMGRLLMWPERGADMSRILLVQWWDRKFEEMCSPVHRFRYDDLLSGCFSTSAAMFKACSGFNESLYCREDYELGIRLLRAGAEFRVAEDALGVHHDKVTDRKRGYQRKYQEGLADMDIALIHPGYSATTRLANIDPRGMAAFFVYRLPLLGPLFRALLETSASLCLRYSLRKAFLKTDQALQDLWYLQGVREKTRSIRPITLARERPEPFPEFEISLAQCADGLELHLPCNAEVVVKAGGWEVCRIAPVFGAEPMKREHVMDIMVKQYAYRLLQAMAMEGLAKKNIVDEKRESSIV